MSATALEMRHVGEFDNLVQRVLGGEVIVFRSGLQQLDVLEAMVQASLEGIRSGAGDGIADRVAREGFDRIHEWVDAADIPRITDRVYDAATRITPALLEKIIPKLFPGEGAYYFERQPNVRFHIPYDLAAAHRAKYDEFARDHGQGKIAPHGPHRDSWLDCPDNVVNLWIAVGPVKLGNGLSIFLDDYRAALSYKDCGEIADRQALRPPLNFELQPGDILLFHSDQLHASELNRTASTRYVVSFRVSFGKPHFPNGHYHHYDSGSLATGPLRALAGIPANLQWSYFRFRLQWLVKKLRGGTNGNGRVAPGGKAKAKASGRQSEALEAASIPVGAIRPLDAGTCVARLDEDQIVAVQRRCPHKGADLTNGFVRDGQIVCPWHNLTFDPETGASPCSVLPALRRHACEVRDGRVEVLQGAPQEAGSAEQPVTAGQNE